MTALTQRARDVAGRLKSRAEKIQEWSTSSQRVVDLLKPEMDKFDAKEAPWDIYTVRMSVDHVSSIRTQAKEIADLAEAAAIISELVERIDVMRDALGNIARDSNPDWTENRVYPQDVLDEVNRMAVEAYYAPPPVLGKQDGEG